MYQCVLNCSLVLLGLLPFFQVQLGKCLTGVGELDAVDDLLACTDRASDESQGPESVRDKGRLGFEMEQVQYHKEELIGKAEAKQNQVVSVVGFEDGVASL